MDAIKGGDVASARFDDWHTIPWAQTFGHVRRLQTRIEKAAKVNRPEFVGGLLV